jgi:hypothetical protein
MYKGIALFLLQLGGAAKGVVIAVAVQYDLGAVLLGAAQFGDWRRLRHHDRRMDVVALGGKSQTLGVVAGRGGDDAGVLLRVAQAENRIHCATVLVGAGALQVLHLQMDVATGPFAQARREVAGRQVDQVANSAARGSDVIERDRNLTCHFVLPCSGQCRDALDLDEDIERQTRDLDRGARRRVTAERALVDRVHLGKIAQVLEEDRRLEHFREAAAGCLKDGAEVRQDPFGLRLDAARHDLHGCRVERDLPRAED